MTPSTQHTTYPHQVLNLNTSKAQQLKELANEITHGCRELQPHVMRSLLNGDALPKYPALPTGTKTRTRLTARQLKTVGNTVHDNLASHLTILEAEVRGIINHSTLKTTLPKHDLITLYRVNKYHYWWCKPGITLLWRPNPKTGELEPCNRKARDAREVLVPEHVLKLARRLVKQARKRHHEPSYREGAGLRLDGIIAEVQEVKSSKSPEIGYWVKVSTLHKRHPIYIPLKKNSYYESALVSKGNATRAGAVQLVYRDGSPEFGLIIKSDPAPPVQANGVTGVDWGVTDGLLVTNMGDLFGQRFLRRIKELDEQLTVHDGNLRVMGLPVRTDATHKRLVKRLRDFTVNEVGRILNRILEEPDAHGEVISRLVSEDLDFRHGGLSATSNRIVQRAGRGVLKRRLGELEAARGVESVLVDPAYTSRECSGCGVVDAGSRKTRSLFECVACGLRLHADVNAARVILGRGVRALGLGGGYSAWLGNNGGSVLRGLLSSRGVRSRGVAGPRALAV